MVILAHNSNVTLPITKPLYTYKNKYESIDFNNTKIIMLGSDSGSIRKTDPKAWVTIKKQIDETTAKNIIIITKLSPLTQFADVREGQALHNYLKEKKELQGKNIFVIHTQGTENEVRIEQGIRYIQLSGLASTTDDLNEASYLKFKLSGEDLYYTFNKAN